MEKGTLIGVVGGIAVIIFGMLMSSGGDIATYYDTASVLITILGSFGSVLVGTPWTRIKMIPRLMGMTFREMVVDPAATVETLVTFAEKARREGVLSLEDDVDEIPDPFLKKAIQLVVDGTDPEVVKRIMSNEINQLEGRHDQYRKILEDWGYLAPSFGMIGTLIGLISMLDNIGGDTTAIGAAMGTALITTLYGAIMANLIFIPMGYKLDLYNQLEVLMKEIIVEGVLSIQAGDNPAILRERLNAFIAVSKRGGSAAAEE